MKTYDYIVTGAGCAGLSLLVRMIRAGLLKNRKVLLVDRDFARGNDRTWCFWESKAGLFEPLVSKSWATMNFHGDGRHRLLSIAPYHYKMIRGGDFYEACLSEIRSVSSIELLSGELKEIRKSSDGDVVVVDSGEYKANIVFNSVMLERPGSGFHYYFLKQHFKGWFIKTEKPVFEPSLATLMDFRVSQKHGTTFVYVLPTSANTALVEYTLFTKDLLHQGEYDDALREYIRLYITGENYLVEQEEFGVIPMTNFPFRRREGNTFNIGTAGGHTKASSGYTFQFIQRHTQRIVDDIMAFGSPRIDDHWNSRKFSFYDSVLLQVLDGRKLEGDKLFSDLLLQGDPRVVLKFLDNQTNLREDIKIMWRLPKGPFTLAAIRELVR